MPRDIKVKLPTEEIKSRRIINEWDLEILAREVIIIAPQTTLARSDLRNWNHLASAVNKLKTIEGAIGEHIINQSRHRLAHRQFPYQSQGFNYDHMTRYYKAFSSSEIDAIAQEEIGLSLSEMYMMGLTLMGTYKNRFSLQSEHEASTEQASRTK